MPKLHGLSGAIAPLLATAALIIGAGALATGSAARASPAARGVTLGAPVLGGDGCDVDTLRLIATGPARFDLVFRDLTLTTSDGAPIGTRFCELARPVSVPAGVQVRIRGAAWSGRTRIGGGGRVQVSRAYYWSGAHGHRTTDAYDATATGPLLLDDARDAGAKPWTPCQPHTTRRLLRISIEVSARGDATTTTIREARDLGVEIRPCGPR